MPVTISTDPSRDLTTFSAKGVLTFEEAMSVVKAFYDGKPTANVLWDLADAHKIEITSDQLQAIVDFNPRYEGKRACGKTAFLAIRDLQFGFSRVFQSQSRIKDAPYHIGVFRDMETAVNWLENK